MGRVIEEHQEAERPIREHQVRAELDALLMRVAQYGAQRRIHAIVRRRSRKSNETQHEQRRSQERHGPPCPTPSHAFWRRPPTSPTEERRRLDRSAWRQIGRIVRLFPTAHLAANLTARHPRRAISK